MRKLILVFAVLWASHAFAQKHEDLWKIYTERRDLPTAIEKTQARLRELPDDVDLQLLLGRALTDSGRFADAKAPLRRVMALDTDRTWRTAWALAYLGRAEFATGDRAAARKAFDEVIAMNSTPNVTRNARHHAQSLGVAPSFDEWTVKESDHFLFHFAPSAQTDGRFVTEHEAAYSEIARFFGASAAGKIDFYVWGDSEAQREQMKLGFAIPEFGIVHAHEKQTVGHEMTHVIAWRAVRPVKETGLISEGTAIVFDFAGIDPIARARKQLGPDRKVTVEELWTNWRSAPERISYPLAGAFVRHLIDRGGKERFLKLLRDQTLESARSIYGDDLPAIISSLEAKLQATN